MACSVACESVGFKWVCANVVRSLVEYYNLWYVLATLETTHLLIAIVVGLLPNTMACLQKNVTSN